jgi:AbrB family looped-hinge helix DNA binding protein
MCYIRITDTGLIRRFLAMGTVTISSKYQIVIPRDMREQFNLKPGQKITVLAYDNRIVMIPERPIKEARGTLKGMNTDNIREVARRR